MMLLLTLVLDYGPCDRRHFQNMMARYGEPILVLDLVKKKEKKAREVGLLGNRRAQSVHGP